MLARTTTYLTLLGDISLARGRLQGTEHYQAALTTTPDTSALEGMPAGLAPASRPSKPSSSSDHHTRTPRLRTWHNLGIFLLEQGH